MQGKLGSFADKVDDDGVYSHGQPIATSGAMRFKSEPIMWKFLRENQGRLNHVFSDGTSRIYVNTDPAATGQDADLVRSMRKLTWAIIESFGGDGEELKKEKLFRNYSAGIIKLTSDEGVWGEVASWSDETRAMVFQPAGERFKDAFLTLLGQKPA